MAFYNGAGGTCTVTFTTDQGTTVTTLCLTDWQYESHARLGEITAADSTGTSEFSPDVVDLAGSIVAVWDSVATPESAGIREGTFLGLKLFVGASGKYYDFDAVVESYRPKLSVHEGALHYEFTFRANGVQPFLSDVNDEGEVAEPTDIPVPATTKSGIEYRILHDGGTGYQESFHADGYVSSYICLVAWDDSDNFVSDMLGTHSLNAGEIQRNNPENHLYFPQLQCLSLETVRNFGPPDFEPIAQGMIRYNEVAYRAGFGPTHYRLGDDEEAHSDPNLERTRYITARQMPGIDSVTRQGFGFVWADGPNATPPNNTIPTPPALLLPLSTWSLTWWFVPGVPRDFISNCLGGVNQNDFSFLLKDDTVITFDAETALLQGWEPELMPVSINDTVLWKITYHFAVREGCTWNQIFNPTDGQFHNVKVSGTGDPPYAKVDMNTIFMLS